MSPSELFQALDFDPQVIYSNDYPLFPDGRILDNPDTRWNELKILGWIGLFPGANRIEARCMDNTLIPDRDSNTTNTNLEFCIERDMENAWEALRSAKDELQAMEAEHDDAVAGLQESYSQALDSVEAAQDKVERLHSGGTEDELLRRKFASAQADLNTAKQDLEDLLNADPIEVAGLRNALTLARANRDDAASSLESLLNPDPTEVSVRRRQVAAAGAERDGAADDLQKIHDRMELQVALQEATVDAAQAKVEGEMRRYEESTLRAPWDGYIASIPVETGQEVEPFEVILTVINSGIVNVEGSVDEIDVLSLRREEPVSVTIDAPPRRGVGRRHHKHQLDTCQ